MCSIIIFLEKYLNSAITSNELCRIKNIQLTYLNEIDTRNSNATFDSSISVQQINRNDLLHPYSKLLTGWISDKATKNIIAQCSTTAL